MNQEQEFRRIKRKLRNSFREVEKAVERMAEIDPLPGHLAEARRRAIAVRDAAEAAILEFDKRTD